MNAMVRRYSHRAVVASGWGPGSELENRATVMLHSVGFRPGDLVQQHSVGRYRLDFADPDVLIAIEIDGFHHRMPGKAEKDAERDLNLLRLGWFTFRVSDEHGDYPMRLALLNAVMLLRSEREYQGRGKSRDLHSRKKPQPSRLALAHGYLPPEQTEGLA